MLLCVHLRVGEQFLTSVEVSKCLDTEAVGGVKLGLEEVAARITDFNQLQDVSSWKKHLQTRVCNISVENIYKNVTRKQS